MYGVGIETFPLRGLSVFGWGIGAEVKKVGFVGGADALSLLLLEKESVVKVGLVLDRVVEGEEDCRVAMSKSQIPDLSLILTSSLSS